MKLQLIDGNFNQAETIDLLTQLYQVKIKFHEEKVKSSLNEEDIKMRERKIKVLQNTLAEAREYIKSENRNFHINNQINF